MTEQDNSLTEGQQERELWPGRYLVEAEAEKLLHRSRYYRDVWLSLFQPDMSEEESRALLEPLGFEHDMMNNSYLYIRSQAEDTFSEKQADELIAYLETHQGVKATKKPAYKPAEGHAGQSARAVGGMEGVIHLSEQGKYELDFVAFAYYSIEHSEYIGLSSKEEAKRRQKIDESISLMDEDELDELQEWIDGRHERDMKQALINSINQLLTGMTVEELEMIETYIAKIE